MRSINLYKGELMLKKIFLVTALIVIASGVGKFATNVLRRTVEA